MPVSKGLVKKPNSTIFLDGKSFFVLPSKNALTLIHLLYNFNQFTDKNNPFPHKGKNALKRK